MYGERIAECRNRKHLTQQQLAEAIGVSKNTVFSWEKGLRKPDIDSLSMLADFFGVTTDYLLGKETEGTNDADIKFAVFGDPDVTDAQFEEIKKIARIIRERDKK